ncbi:hypothetical protein HA466_0029840 [Hirschfeldia incana]|nr:hypothetical protein HA466_0029840 [Hirschfeldia incana]
MQIGIVLGKLDKFDSLVPPVTNGKTPEKIVKAESKAADEAEQEADGGGGSTSRETGIRRRRDDKVME